MRVIRIWRGRRVKPLDRGTASVRRHHEGMDFGGYGSTCNADGSNYADTLRIVANDAAFSCCGGCLGGNQNSKRERTRLTGRCARRLVVGHNRGRRLVSGWRLNYPKKTFLVPVVYMYGGEHNGEIAMHISFTLPLDTFQSLSGWLTVH